MPRISTFLTALRELGPTQLGLYALYRFNLKSGGYSRTTPPEEAEAPGAFQPALPAFPNREALAACAGPDGTAAAIRLGREIIAGKVRLFGGEPVDLVLVPPGPLQHWTEYELGRAEWGVEDPKFLWEPARFGWAFSLGNAWLVSGEETFPESFWRCLEIFLEGNPVDQGPNWASGQEVALRLMALGFAGQVFANASASTPERMQLLAEAIAAHARRIPPTLIYARSQHNNHLLSEAAGLFTAGACLPDHPRAAAWREAGWRWLNRGLQAQISASGSYAQHSVNYHRLALSLALWAGAVARLQGLSWSQATREKLAAATRWLLTLADPVCGRVPNLGPNDGALFLPFSNQGFGDYRPVLQAASQTFTGAPAFPPGPYDELSLWFQAQGPTPNPIPEVPEIRAAGAPPPSPHVLHGGDSRAYLRAAHFNSRPGHADQLHLDLWWRGLNVTLDPGTYRYTASAPWENALAGTAVHNTLSLGDRDQMQRAGKFLYLGWAQGQMLEYHRAPDGSWERLVASHDGYRRWGYLHQRSVERRGDRWKVIDSLPPTRSAAGSRPALSASVHWLFPDWPFEIEAGESHLTLQLTSPFGPLQILIDPAASYMGPLAARLVRAGEALSVHGDFPAPACPTLGWYSPTYNAKQPALSLTVRFDALPNLALQTSFLFPS